MSSFQRKVTRCAMKLKSETHTPEKKEANENMAQMLGFPGKVFKVAFTYMFKELMKLCSRN